MASGPRSARSCSDREFPELASSTAGCFLPSGSIVLVGEATEPSLGQRSAAERSVERAYSGRRRPARASGGRDFRYATAMSQLGRGLLVLGLLLAFVGLLLVLGGKLGLGRLPGDIAIERRNFTFHFPVATSIVLSVLLTVLLNLWLRRR